MKITILFIAAIAMFAEGCKDKKIAALTDQEKTAIVQLSANLQKAQVYNDSLNRYCNPSGTHNVQMHHYYDSLLHYCSAQFDYYHGEITHDACCNHANATGNMMGNSVMENHMDGCNGSSAHTYSQHQRMENIMNTHCH